MNYIELMPVFTAVIFQVEVFWVVTPCSVVVRYHYFRGPRFLHFQSEVTSLHPEDGGSMDLRKIGVLPQHYTASEPRNLDLKPDTLNWLRIEYVVAAVLIPCILIPEIQLTAQFHIQSELTASSKGTWWPREVFQ
jgi:hypothetical protein